VVDASVAVGTTIPSKTHVSRYFSVDTAYLSAKKAHFP
jgi:hypothetical protein